MCVFLKCNGTGWQPNGCLSVALSVNDDKSMTNCEFEFCVKMAFASCYFFCFVLC